MEDQGGNPHGHVDAGEAYRYDMQGVAAQAAVYVRQSHAAVLHGIPDEEERAEEAATLTKLHDDLQRIAEAGSLSSCRDRCTHSTLKLFRAIDCALMLESCSAGLREVCEKAVLLLLPGINTELFLPLDTLPSPTSVKRHMVTLEVAYLLLEREFDKLEGQRPVSDRPPRYGLSDSSPAWGLEWLWTQHYSVDGDGVGLPELLETCQEFIAGMLAWQSQEFEQETRDAYLQNPDNAPRHLRDLLRGIVHRFQVHTHTPSSVASGFQSLVRKLAAALLAFAFGRCSAARLYEFLDTFMSWTSDMGTEFGFGDFRVKDANELLPSWLRLDPNELDVDQEEAAPMEADVEYGYANADVLPDDDLLDVDDAGADRMRFVFRWALIVPGTLHIIHNMLVDMHKMYPGWKELWQKLKVFEKLLSKRYRRNRFINTCITDGVCCTPQTLAGLQSFSEHLYEKRWSAVISFIRALVPLFPTICRAWSAAKFAANVDKDGKPHEDASDSEDEEGDSKWDPAKLTECTRSTGFRLELECMQCIEKSAAGHGRLG